MDPYAVLGVPRGATKDEIKKKYRELTRLWHPDKVQPQGRAGAEKKMQEINRAYEQLMKEPDTPYQKFRQSSGTQREKKSEWADPFGFANKSDFAEQMRKWQEEIERMQRKKAQSDFQWYQDFAYTNARPMKKCPHCNGTGEIPA